MTEKCLECNEPAEYIRSTQFAGDHPYCYKHASQQSDWEDEPDSYSYWFKIVRAEDEFDSNEIDIEKDFQ